MGMSALTRCMKPPLSMSAPLAFWALMILSVSSSRVGTNRRAMVIIMAISCTFTWNTFRGRKSLSIASVRAVGEVVKVSAALRSIRHTMRMVMNTARFTPPSVICMKPICTRTRPEP